MDFGYIENSRSKILDIIKDKKEVSPRYIINNLLISERRVFVILKSLLEQGVLEKYGSPPFVYYKLKEKSEKLYLNDFNNKEKSIIEENFIYFTPKGELLRDENAFIKWCVDRKIDYEKEVKTYIKTLEKYSNLKVNGLIDATSKFKNTFKKTAVEKMYYKDFYSIEKYGRTKLGSLVFFSKLNQSKKLINEVVNICKKSINSIIKKEKIEYICFIPHTINRKVQFMKVVENSLKLNLKTIKLEKISRNIPQKSIKKLEDRIINAKSTMYLVNKKDIKGNALIIDDAVGSGATINETASKIKPFCKGKIYGFSFVGSYKGYDVISEV